MTRQHIQIFLHYYCVLLLKLGLFLGYLCENIEQALQLTELYRLIQQGGKEFIPDRPGEPRHTFADISKAQKYLSWYPKIDFLEGVSDMLKDINLWSEAPLWTSESISKETKNWFRFMGNKWN